MDSLHLHSQDSDVTLTAIWALANIAALVSGRPQLKQAGAHRAAEQALQRFKDNKEICAHAERLRSRLS